MSIVIGIGGLSGSGKSHISSHLANQYGFQLIDLDLLGHKTLEEFPEPVIAEFGKTICDENGNIDRKKLGGLVFSDPLLLVKLEKIVHPIIIEKAKVIISKSSHSSFIIDGALLIKMELSKLCDFVFWIQAPWMTRAKRIEKRDGISHERAIMRMRAQIMLNTQAKSANADIIKVVNRRFSVAIRSILCVLRYGYGTKTRSFGNSSFSRFRDSSFSHSYLAILSKPSINKKTS